MHSQLSCWKCGLLRPGLEKFAAETMPMGNIASLMPRQTFQSFTDKELADLYRSSANQELLAELFSRYSDLLFGICVKYLKDMDTAADACNDIYLELVEKMLKHEVQHVKAWIHTLARNHCLMKLRGEKKMHIDEFSDQFMQLEDSWHPDIALERENQLTTLELCLDTLKGEQKKAVTLFYIEQKSYNEIADLTGIPWNNIRSHIQNGRRNLKICMDTHEGSAGQ